MKLDGKELTLEIKDHYAKKDLWSIEEFIALILKQNPWYFSLRESMKNPVVKNLYDLVIIGIRAGKLPVTHDVYGSQLDSGKFLKPLDGQAFAKKKDLPLDMEELINKYHEDESEDLKTEKQELKQKVKELQEKVKELEEDQLKSVTKKGYDKAIATVVTAFCNSSISSEFNGNRIINLCETRGTNFDYIKDPETLRKYIAGAQKLMGIK